MQEDDGTDGRAIRLQDIGPVPILREVTGKNGAAFEVPVRRYLVGAGKALRHLDIELFEDRFLGSEVAGPVRLVQLGTAQFVRDIGMPELERSAPLAVIGSHGQQR